jgi:hypothetical protein
MSDKGRKVYLSAFETINNHVKGHPNMVGKIKIKDKVRMDDTFYRQIQMYWVIRDQLREDVDDRLSTKLKLQKNEKQL